MALGVGESRGEELLAEPSALRTAGRRANTAEPTGVEADPSRHEGDPPRMLFGQSFLWPDPRHEAVSRVSPDDGVLHKVLRDRL